MLKICTNSLILFLFLKREFRLVSKTKVYLHGYKIWSHTALSKLLNFFPLELKLRLKIILVQCSLKLLYLVCGTCIWFMTKFLTMQFEVGLLTVIIFEDIMPFHFTQYCNEVSQ